MYDREQLIWDLVSAELTEGRVTDFFRGAKAVDPNAVLTTGSAVSRGVPGYQLAAHGARGRALQAGRRVRGAVVPAATAVRDYTIGPMGSDPAYTGRATPLRGTPGWQHSLAKRGVGMPRVDVRGKAAAAGDFISKGARFQGIRGTLKPRTTIVPAPVGGTGASISHGRNLGGFAGGVGRSAAVYGSAAALTAGGIYGGRALYKRSQARRAEKKDKK